MTLPRTDGAPMTRRNLLRGLVAGSALLVTRGAFADELVRTPRLTEGPFYPDRMPLDTDNDLLIINDGITPAVGAITFLSGHVLTAAGSPVRNATVEIWQVDASGIYLNSTDRRRPRYDENFQGYGRFLTDAAGRYGFRTIKPAPYPGRAPHIHLAVNQNGRRVLTTQVLVRGDRRNAGDGVLRRVRDRAARESLVVDFAPLPDSRIGELAAEFDVVLGATPSAPDEPVKGAISPSEFSQRGGRRHATPRPPAARAPRGRIY